MEERSFYYRYCLIIPTIYPKLSQYLETSLQANDFDIQSFEEDKKRYICISQKNEQRMLKEAEALKIKKPKYKELSEEEALLLDKRIIEQEKKEYFISDKYIEYNPPKEYNDFYELLYGSNKKKEINKRYGLGLFTESEMLSIEKSILENIPVTNIEELNELLSTEGDKSNSLLQELNKSIKKPLIEENSLFNTLINYNIIEDYFALHISDFFQKINSDKFISEANPNLIRSYFNDEVALYFSWLNHYTQFVIFPTIISIMIFICNKFSVAGINTELLHIFYALGIILWVQFFIIFWSRKESNFKVLWDNDSKEFEKEDKRKEFIGDMKTNVITGKDELVYSEKKQFMNYLTSFGVTLIFICIALYINVVSLNIRGLIPEDRHQFLVITKYKKQNSEKGSPWYFILIKTFILTFFGNLYSNLNKYLTENENHRSKTNYYNSFIIKKFIFDSFNYFFEIFYIAFALKDIKETSKSVFYYFYLRKYLRIIFEFIFPFIRDIFCMKSEKEKKEPENYEKSFILGEPIDSKEVIKQSKYSKFNSFSEYYPLIQEFCFLTLFASCATLSPILILINNNLEIKDDLKKFCTKYRRPEVEKKRNIGAWKYIIEFIGIMSILSNIMFCYLYNDTFGETKYSLFSFIFGEHILLLVIIALRFFIPLNENWARIYKLRKFFKKREEFHIKMKKNKEKNE